MCVCVCMRDFLCLLRHWITKNNVSFLLEIFSLSLQLHFVLYDFFWSEFLFKFLCKNVESNKIQKQAPLNRRFRRPIQIHTYTNIKHTNELQYKKSLSFFLTRTQTRIIKICQTKLVIYLMARSCWSSSLSAWTLLFGRWLVACLPLFFLWFKRSNVNNITATLY